MFSEPSNEGDNVEPDDVLTDKGLSPEDAVHRDGVVLRALLRAAGMFHKLKTFDSPPATSLVHFASMERDRMPELPVPVSMVCSTDMLVTSSPKDIA